MIGVFLHKRQRQRYLDEFISVCLHEGEAFSSMYHKKKAEKFLSNWGIGDSDTLYWRIQWLLEEGHRAEFLQIRNYLSTFSERDRQALFESLTPNDDKLSQLKIVEQSMHRLPEEGIAAFDWAWCILLLTAGSTLELIADEPAEGYSTQAAVKIQETYSGWTEYLYAYTVGAAFSGRFGSEDFSQKHAAYYQALLRAWQHPFNRLNWKNMPLRSAF